jgi:hypothetical protein
MKCSRSLPALCALSLLAGCATHSRTPWRAGASRSHHPQAELGQPGDAREVSLYRKPAFGAFDQTEGRRIYACGTTTVLRKAQLLDPQDLPSAPRGQRWEPIADLTTEEFPRDEARSELRGDTCFNLLGVGDEPWDLFEVRLDPAFLPDALERLRHLAAELGAEAVIDVHATGAAEFHMYHGFRLGLDPQESTSPLFSNLRLLGLSLRDVRLHGTAVRHAD